MAWKASFAHRTGENEEKKDNAKIKKSVQTSSACGKTGVYRGIHFFLFLP